MGITLVANRIEVELLGREERNTPLLALHDGLLAIGFDVNEGSDPGLEENFIRIIVGQKE